jgi:hypothetical protein
LTEPANAAHVALRAVGKIGDTGISKKVSHIPKN